MCSSTKLFRIKERELLKVEKPLLFLCYNRNELWGDVMKKKELLVPAGDMDCLRQAVFHGADAVYLACKNFGARKFATNFTNEEIVEAIRFCHLYGVRIYVTMNTLIRDSEVESFINQARFLHQNGVDALIVQDLGMIYLLRKTFPNLEIHASTQANNSSRETVQMFHDMGVKRVVFSRELSIDEIDAMDIPIEKEVFIHGALCVSYSGCCLMRSMNGGRSGNRGECAGSCRLPYSLLKNGEYLSRHSYILSMKELNTSSEMERLLNSSIDSFKIEGRMKGPLYVGFITNFYRRFIDGEEINYSEEIDRLKTIFNREFTVGHLFGVEGSKLINASSPNHIGLKIGTVSVHKNKIQIQLDSGKTLHQHDSIRFLHSNKGMVVNYLYDEKDNLCSSSKGTCYVDNKVELDSDDVLMKTQDHLLEKEYLVEESLYPVPVSFHVLAKVGEPLTIAIDDGEHKISLSGENGIEALSRPTTEDVIIEKLSKLGDTPFTLKDVSFEMDSHIFIPMTHLNEMRRELVSLLIEDRQNRKVEFVEETVEFPKMRGDKHTGSSCFVRNEEQMNTCLSLPFDRIYTTKELYETYKEHPQVICYMGRCPYQITPFLQERNVVADGMNCSNVLVYGTYALNVTNIYTAYYLKQLGYQNIPLSVELTEKEIEELLSSYQSQFGDASFEVFTYGRVENMIINSNILNLKMNDASYQLEDIKNHLFPVYYDGRLTHIYHYEIQQNKRMDGTCSFFDFYQETGEEIRDIVNRVLG